jgi:hypothetical protein
MAAPGRIEACLVIILHSRRLGALSLLKYEWRGGLRNFAEFKVAWDATMYTERQWSR